MPLVIFCDRTVRFVSALVGNPKDWFSHNEAQFMYLPSAAVYATGTVPFTISVNGVGNPAEVIMK